MNREHIFSRRTLLTGAAIGTAFALTQSVQKRNTTIETQPSFSTLSVENELSTLVLNNNVDKDISAVFTGGYVSFMKPSIYKLPAEVLAYYGNNVTETVLYIPETNSDNNEDFTGVHSKIGFSDKWYEMTTPKAKIMTANFAARQYLQMPAFCRFQYKHSLENGLVVPHLPDEMAERIFATKLGMQILENDERAHKLFTHAPFLHMMQEYKQLGEESNVDLKRDLDIVMPESIRNFSQHINFNNYELALNQSNYAELAFGDNEWTDFVMSI